MRVLAIAAALALSACTVPGLVADGPAPAPLTATSADETALALAWEGFDLALYAVDAGVAAGKIKGERAKQVKAALLAVNDALVAAAAARRAGSTTDLRTALDEANAALAAARRLIRTEAP